MKRVAFYTLGCKTNQYDSEAMKERFLERGYRVVDFREDSDVYVVNTCTVTNLGERKSRQMIHRAHRRNPDAVIAVVGCYAQQAAEEVLAIPGVRVALGTNSRNCIVDCVERSQAIKAPVSCVENIREAREFEDMPIHAFAGKTRAALKIQEGCSQFCTYCIIPYVRGPIRSRNPESIRKEAERLSEAGFREIVLTGIHIASYGRDRQNTGGTDLLALLKDLHTIRGIERIRLGSLEPTLLTDKFVNEARDLPKICRHYHISLQSGCDATLKRMNRRYTTAEYREIVRRLRCAIPEVAVTTDIMVGFPGETEEEFAATCAFAESMEFSKIHVFPYSPREGTPAASFEHQVPPEVRECRSRKMVALSRKLEQNYMEQFIGRRGIVLFEKAYNGKEGLMEGHTDHYIKALVPGGPELEGKLLPVLFGGREKDCLTGHVTGTDARQP
ncbi:tRNA (N(6)-L-threonylcarbamoyladenosine(37)-C(2))-methylthiotransferase MtaB [Eubacteriales bacterium mix99]